MTSSTLSGTMSLSALQLSQLLTVLSPEILSAESLEAACARVVEHFPSRSDAFKIGLALVQLLTQPDLLCGGQHQVFAALIFLYDLYKSEPFAQNPFAAVFVKYLQVSEEDTEQRQASAADASDPSALEGFQAAAAAPRLSPSEKQFLAQLVTGQMPAQQAKNWFRKSAPAISSQFPAGSGDVDLSGIQVALAERESELPHTARSGASVVVADPSDMLGHVRGPAYAKGVIEALLRGDSGGGGGEDAPMARTLRPEPVRPVPPLHLDEEEMMWTNPMDSDYSHHFDLFYDRSMCDAHASLNETKRLMARACKGPLSPANTNQLKGELERDPTLVLHTGFTPQMLPELVEHNPLIATEVLLKLVETRTGNFADYYAVLVNMDMSLHSMEVVNMLTTTVELPKEFLHLYICNCISTCETKNHDKYVQNRLVRLLCVFLQSLIRNKIINVKELFIEVQAFCIEFSRIREAAALFRLLKQLESGDPAGGLALSEGAESVVNAGVQGGNSIGLNLLPK